MELEHRELERDGETYEGRLTVPRGEPEGGVLVVPGAGHGPFGDVFDVVAHHLVGDGRLVYRRSRPSASGLDPEGEGRKLR